MVCFYYRFFETKLIHLKKYYFWLRWLQTLHPFFLL